MVEHGNSHASKARYCIAGRARPCMPGLRLRPDNENSLNGSRMPDIRAVVIIRFHATDCVIHVV